jgi:hypothetical protein
MDHLVAPRTLVPPSVKVAASCPILSFFIKPCRTPGFFGDRDEAFDSEGKLGLRDYYMRSAKPGFLEKTSKVACVEGPVCLRSGKRPFLHRFTRGHVDDKTAARSQHAADF